MKSPLPASPDRRPELLAPAGDRDAACAAFHHGADAVYFGLRRFSARADAVNFDRAQAEEIAAYAHALTPPRRAYAVVNTLVLEDELDALLETLLFLDAAGVDGVMVQDLGAVRLLQRFAPRLPRAASTQLAIHNPAGAQTLRALGFRRAILARELTLDEIRRVAAESGLETEVFIHGALCYCYSGLCLFSSLLRGRSGNRGRCAYPCRELYRPAVGAGRSAHVFSMKDLAMLEDVAALRAAGVTGFKIEGRKKKDLYVAAATRLYRGLLDGRLKPAERAELAADLQTIFSRPWTRLFLRDRRNRDVVDTEITGHRGAPIGTVALVRTNHAGRHVLRFVTARPLELHDGLQLDLPGESRPYGFAVDELFIATAQGAPRPTITAPAGATVEVTLEPDHPNLPVGAAVYCSSSQAVRRRYAYDRPKPGLYRPRLPARFVLRIAANEARAQAFCRLRDVELTATATLPADPPFAPARTPGGVAEAAHGAFAKLGDTPFALERLEVENPAGLFVPVSQLNELRRRVCAALAEQVTTQRAAHYATALAAMHAEPLPAPPSTRPRGWILQTDQPDCLAEFEAQDWEDVGELCLQIGELPLPALEAALARCAAAVGRERIRLGLPIITRAWEEAELRAKIAALRVAGWTRWQAANLSAWTLLGLNPAHPAGEINLTCDWPLYVTNTAAVRQLLEMGAQRVTLSPEDGRDNMQKILERLGGYADVIVYQDTPLFISETCARASACGGCAGGLGAGVPSPRSSSNSNIRDEGVPAPVGNRGAVCREELRLHSATGAQVRVFTRGCRTWVIHQQPQCLAAFLPELRAMGAERWRADFILRPYPPEEARRIWRALRAGEELPLTRQGNYLRGLRMEETVSSTGD